MIQFFRLIRQRLLHENRFPKYLLYAIGEIVLVVIGILIALNINNQNEANLTKVKERILLNELSENLEHDIKELKKHMEFYKLQLRSSQMVLNHLENNEVRTDSLGIFYNSIGGYLMFNNNASAYDNLKSIGFDLISSDSLRRQITNLYSSDYAHIKHSTEIWDANININIIYPQVITNIKREMDYTTAQPLDIEKLRTNDEFKEMLKLYSGVKQYTLNRSQQTLNSINSLKNNILKELEKE
jgi:hypothetical protein